MATDDFGVDISTFAGVEGSIDVDPLGPAMSGPRVALEGIARRLSTRHGSLAHAGLPDYGFDLTTLAAKRMSNVAKLRAQERIRQEAEKEQGVLGVTATISEIQPNSFRVTLSVRLASGPYPLVLQVSNLSVQVLRTVSG